MVFSSGCYPPERCSSQSNSVFVGKRVVLLQHLAQASPLSLSKGQRDLSYGSAFVWGTPPKMVVFLWFPFKTTTEGTQKERHLYMAVSHGESFLGARNSTTWVQMVRGPLIG